MPSALRLSLLLLAAALALPAAAAADKTVNPGDDANAVVDSAAAGETITFRAGTHNGPVSVEDANITLKGEPGAIIVTTSGTDPVVSFSGSDGIVSDLTIVSTTGGGVVFGSGANQLLRSTVVTLAEGGTAVSLPAGANRTLAADSSVLVGAKALTTGIVVPFVGTVAVTARHLTALGALETAGPSEATFTLADSIVGGAVDADITGNAASVRNLIGTAAEVAGLFVRPGAYNFHLRADAAKAIDQGKLSAGESTTDIDGDPRATGDVSDLGADEFVNKAPTATLAKPAAVVRQGVATTFTATGTDPERASGGGITSYTWSFGDGSTETTASPTVSHAFAERKTYTVSVTVTDKQGATSAPATADVTVIDGTAPTVTIAQPGAKQRLNLYRKAKKGKRAKRQRVTFFGSAADDTALGSVVLALRKVAVKNGTCSWYNAKRGFTKGDCTSPVLLTAKLTGGRWRYTLPIRARLPRGPYKLYAVAIDATQLAGGAASVDFRFR